jgi:hypothetical protein
VLLPKLHPPVVGSIYRTGAGKMKEESVGRIHTTHTSTETNLKEYKAERGEKRRRIDDDPSRAQ